VSDFTSELVGRFPPRTSKIILNPLDDWPVVVEIGHDEADKSTMVAAAVVMTLPTGDAQ
jgi:hypothetical protein